MPAVFREPLLRLRDQSCEPLVGRGVLTQPLQEADLQIPTDPHHRLGGTSGSEALGKKEEKQRTFLLKAPATNGTCGWIIRARPTKGQP